MIIGACSMFPARSGKSILMQRAKELGIIATTASDSVKEFSNSLKEFHIIAYDEIPTFDIEEFKRPVQPYYREHFEGRKKKGGRRRY